MNGMGPSVDVVVPTIGRASLRPLLDALVADPPSDTGAIIVVDDRPHGPPLDVPSGVVLRRSGGHGPAAARNVGWRTGRADWVVFLDDDVQPSRGWAAALRGDLERLGGDRTAVSQGIVEVPLPGGRPPTDAERNVAGLAGAPWITADLAVSRWALSLVDGFDEAFPRAYREDTDLAVRLRRGGARLHRGTRRVLHPPGPARWFDSVRRQAGNADDARLARRYGHHWRQVGGIGPGRFGHHVLTTGLLVGGVASLAVGRTRVARLLAAGWLSATARFVGRRLRGGPGGTREVLAMTVTSALIPPAAVGWRVGGWVRARSFPARSTAPGVRAVLFDRDGTLVDDVPYNGDPARVRLRPRADTAVRRAREAGLRIGLITNQSGVGRGLITGDDVDAVHRRLEDLLGPFDTVVVCPHTEADGCRCRKPAPGMVLEAAARLGVAPEACWVVGDIAADVQAAHHAGARSVLVPNGRTRPEEIRLAARVAGNLDEALDVVLGACP